MIGEGYTAPRHAMRRLLDGGNGLEVALTFLALAFLVEAMLAIVFGGRAGDLSLGAYLVNIALQLAVFFLLSGLIHGLGRAAGGKGTLAGAQLVVGWHALVTSPLTPLTLGFASAFRAQTDATGAGGPGGPTATRRPRRPYRFRPAGDFWRCSTSPYRSG